MNETPYCFALIMADYVACDASGKWTIVGAFDMLMPAAFPAEVFIGVYVGVTDCRGKMPVKLQIVDVAADFDGSDETPVGMTEGELACDDPLQTVQMTIPIKATFPHHGAYNLELWANGERIITRRITVREAPPQQAQP